MPSTRLDASREALTLCRSWRNNKHITIALEGTDQTYTVPSLMLRSSSPWFTEALEGRFYESDSRVLHLPGCNEETFQLFLYRLVRGQLPIYDRCDIPEGCGNCPGVPFDDRLIRLWAFGAAIKLMHLQNAVMMALVKHWKHHALQVSFIRLAFTLTSQISILRVAVIHEKLGISADSSSDEEFEEMETIPGYFNEFATEVIRADKLLDSPDRADNIRHLMVKYPGENAAD
jgi:hypothetical protein